MNDLTLVAINAKYPHTNLAVRYLREAVSGFQLEIYEGSVNDSIHGMVDRLLDMDGKIYGFSCYIWNIEIVHKLAEIIKKARPEAIILFGGPEVSYEGESIAKHYPYVDAVITGEGEAPLKDFLFSLSSGKEIISDKIILAESFDHHTANTLQGNIESEKLIELDSNQIKFPYSVDELRALQNRIIYYETMRGCPYNCSYCLSSADKKLQVRNLELVLNEIDIFFAADVKQVKLVDRTFNCLPDRAMTIFDHIVKKGRQKLRDKKAYPNFHFELTGDYIPDQMIDILKKAPVGLLQFEIGVQSTCDKTLKAIGRSISFSEISRNVERLLKAKNIHIHLDLIAGLPYESFEIFKKSFNDVYMLQADMLQLGFLKGLKGTRIWEESYIHGYSFADFSPYEIIRNNYLEASELYVLRNMESLLDRYYNSGYFETVLNYILIEENILNPFEFFFRFCTWWKKKGYFQIGVSKENLYALLYEFVNCEKMIASQIFEDALAFDFIVNNQQKMPDFLKVKQLDKQKIFNLIENENYQHYFLEFSGLATKKIFNRIKVVEFDCSFCEYLFGKNQSHGAIKDTKALVLFTPEQYYYLK
ncbi:DUF4080 domain-containing protein [Eubacteriaceae bacterium ES2]|nr:DUF4080 domain-containing protein [Eubacteriaceae bacterium ES2]